MWSKKKSKPGTTLDASAKAITAEYQTAWVERFKPGDGKAPALDKADMFAIRKLIEQHDAAVVRQLRSSLPRR